MIHPQAFVHPKAKLGTNVTIGPFCTVGEHVCLGDDVRLISHVVVDGRTAIGARTIGYPFAVIGLQPQDLKYHGELSTLEIGTDCNIREHATLHPGTEGGGMITKVGNHCHLMIGSHVAHDCIVGDHVIMSNNATLGGHVVVEEHVIIGGLAAIHQFVRIGQHAFIGGMSAVSEDVIPFGTVFGDRSKLAGLNFVGLKRRGFSRADIHSLRQAYKFLFDANASMTWLERLEYTSQHHQSSEPVIEMVAFIKANPLRALCLPKTNTLSEESFEGADADGIKKNTR